MNRAELMAEIIAVRPAGYFDEVRSLLCRYVDLLAELEDLNAGWWRTWRRKRLDFGRLHELTTAMRSRTDEAIEIAETLHLLPGSRGMPPPKLQ